MAKYQIGDILHQNNVVMNHHFLIEDCKYHYMRDVYFYRVLETNETFQQLVAVIDETEEITKVA